MEDRYPERKMKLKILTFNSMSTQYVTLACAQRRYIVKNLNHQKSIKARTAQMRFHIKLPALSELARIPSLTTFR